MAKGGIMQLYQKVSGEIVRLPLSAITRPTQYELCEFYSFRNSALKPGFQPCQGGVIENAATKYPEAWAYLQTEEGQLLCKSEAEWQAMTQATWGSGTFKASWNGIGGAPYFVQNLEAGTLRMPDLRGMVACATDASLGVGEARGDTIRPASGSGSGFCTNGPASSSTSIIFQNKQSTGAYSRGNDGFYYGLQFILGNGLPCGDVISPKSYGVLTCAYLGQPAAA